MTTWLTLSDYSTKYSVSVSTLRRRIRAGKVETQFEDGKYKLMDLPLDEQHPNTQTQSVQQTNGTAPFAPPQERLGVAVISKPKTEDSLSTAQNNSRGDSESSQFWVAVNAMMSELKKAYSLILQEKEEQILQLKDEHSDLRTLVRVLEEENKRLKNIIENPRSVDAWLEQNETM